MKLDENWLDRQLNIAAAATDKWPEWMRREAGISMENKPKFKKDDPIFMRNKQGTHVLIFDRYDSTLGFGGFRGKTPVRGIEFCGFEDYWQHMEHFYD